MKKSMQELKERWLIVAIIAMLNIQIEVPVASIGKEILIRSIVTAIMFTGIQVLLKLSRQISQDK